MFQMPSFSKLTVVDSFEDVTDPSCVVKCSGVTEFAYVLSFTTNEMSKKSWMKNYPQCAHDDDSEAIRIMNDSLPPCKELSACFTARYKKSLAEFYLGAKVVGPSDQVIFETPDAIFLQRVSPRLKTFDMVFFYGTNYVVFDIVDKSDLSTIRNWYEKKIYSCGVDPLPMNLVVKRLQSHVHDKNSMYDNVYEELFAAESEPSGSEYEPSEDESESESDLDLASEEEGCLDDRCDEEEEEEEEEEEDSEEDDCCWDPASGAPSDSEEEYRTCKRQKI